MRRISIILLLVLALGIAVYFFKKSEKAPIITQSEIRALSIKIGADTAEVRKTKDRWETTEINDAPVQDTRLNSGLINHIIDILIDTRYDRFLNHHGGRQSSRTWQNRKSGNSLQKCRQRSRPASGR